MPGVIFAKPFHHEFSPPATICEVFSTSPALLSGEPEKRDWFIANTAELPWPIFLILSLTKNNLQSREEQRVGQITLYRGDNFLALEMPGVQGVANLPDQRAATIRGLSSALQLWLVPVPCCVCPMVLFIWLLLESGTLYNAAPDLTLCTRYSGSLFSSFC